METTNRGSRRDSNLFAPVALGPMQLANRIVMAPMTRSRAQGNVANELMQRYYAERADAGLIISEGIAPSANGLGYARIPGLFTRAQVDSFRAVTDAVHARGGHIIAQLMHVGRIAHPLNMPIGAHVVAPSAVPASGSMFTDQRGPLPYPTPLALSEPQIAEARDEFRVAALHAREAGFDGVELHAANGYLLEQFTNPHANTRTDGYGGTVDKRLRFVREVAEAAAGAIGADRVGIRLSPYSNLGDLPSYPEIGETYEQLARALRGLLYVHLVDSTAPEYAETRQRVRQAFGGPILRNGGYDRARAQRTLDAGDADLIAFGRPFIANPDLVTRMRTGIPLAQPDMSALYTPGAHGYVDYPSASV